MDKTNWKLWLLVGMIFIVLSVIFAITTELWVILSLGVGFLFGFAIQKGDLCGSSAMSEVLLFKDRSKLFGLWIAIVSSMIGFALLESFGIVQLAPKKMIWLSSIVGGLIFGVGTVLGGGCISGCMYKGATGNLNSIIALLTIPIGISFVDYGPLKPFNDYLLSFVINDANGKPLTLYSITGIPYWLLSIIFLAVTIFVILILKSKSKTKKNTEKNNKFKVSNIFTKSWKPWQAGIVIGIIGVLAWLSSLPIGRNYPLGVTHGVNYAYQLIIDKNVDIVYQKPSTTPNAQVQINQPVKSYSTTNQASVNPKPEPPKPQGKKITLWLVLLVIGFVFGAFVSGKMSGQAKLLPKPPSQLLVSAIGGFLIGTGAALATGCVIGNIISGWAMMSIGMFIFGVATLIGNWITTYFYLIGVQNNKK